MCSISVIIPFYKTPISKLRCCIESFRKQSFSDFEMLLIDDGNENNYDYLRKEYEALDNRIHFIYQKNSGVGAARNHGINLAKGQYIVFCDSDDFVDNNFLFTLFSAIQGHDLAICGVTEQHYSSITSNVDMRVFRSTPSKYNQIQYVNFSVNKMYRNDIIQKKNIRFDTGVKLGEDALFLIKYFDHCKRIHCVSAPLYHYIPNTASATHTYYAEYWDWEKLVIENQYKLFTSYPLCRNEAMYLQRWLYEKMKGALFYYLRNEKNEAIKSIRLKEIMASPYFSLMLDDFEKNTLLSSKARLVLKIWDIAGERGIRLSNRIAIKYRKYNYRRNGKNIFLSNNNYEI